MTTHCFSQPPVAENWSSTARFIGADFKSILSSYPQKLPKMWKTVPSCGGRLREAVLGRKRERRQDAPNLKAKNAFGNAGNGAVLRNLDVRRTDASNATDTRR
jgi:hypothetical protein